jgi:phosphohistidine phosphatase
VEVDDVPAHLLIIAIAPVGTGPQTRNVRRLQRRLSARIRALIWFLRHGEAESAADDDASRRLTEKGERQAVTAGTALAALDAEIDACLTSPKVRALETARIACEALGLEPEVCEALAGGDFDPDELTAGRGTVLLVGHEPDFSRAIQLNTGGRVEMKKGGVAAISHSTLITLLRPAQLRGIANRSVQPSA